MVSTDDVSGFQQARAGLIRWRALAAVLAGVAWAVSGIAHFVLVYPDAGAGPLGSTSAYVIESAHAGAEVGILGALLGFRARQAPSYGRLGAAGFIVAFVGRALLATATVLVTVLMSVGEAEAWEVILSLLFGLGMLGSLVGFTLLGTATLRTRMLPRWCGALLLLYFPAFLFMLNSYGWGGIALGLLQGGARQVASYSEF